MRDENVGSASFFWALVSIIICGMIIGDRPEEIQEKWFQVMEVISLGKGA